MSHSVNIKTQFKDTKLLEAAFESRGWKIVTNQVCRTYPSDPSRGKVHQFVAVNPQANGYDVGIDVGEDGNAFFTCDFFDSSIERQLGKQIKDIKQGYSLAKLKKFMSEEDLNYEVTTLATGQLKVIATK
jgi:hypothetical protein